MHPENRLQNGTSQKFVLKKLSRKPSLLGTFDKRINMKSPRYLPTERFNIWSQGNYFLSCDLAAEANYPQR